MIARTASLLCYKPPTHAVEDPDDTPETEAPPPRPWGLTLSSVLAAGLGFFRLENALGALESSRGSLSQDHPMALWRAFNHATWQYEQQHHSLMVALWSATAVLSALLFFTSTRVFFKVRDTGVLWRQALFAHIGLALVTLRIEQRSGPELLAYFRDAVAHSAQRVEAPEKFTIEQWGQFGVGAMMGGTWLLSILCLALLTYAVRARTRALIG